MLLQRAAVSDRQTRDQLIEGVGGKQAQATTGASAIASEIHNRAEMGVGVVMPPNGLLRPAHHRPAALNMQLHLAEIEPQSGHIGVGVLSNGSHQRGKRRVLVQLPEAVDVAGPGTTRLGIALGLAPQLDHLLHPLGQLQRIGLQLHPG